MGKYRITIDMQKCEGGKDCPLRCIAVCPTKVLAHRPLDFAKTPAEIYLQATHPLLCDGCMACVDACQFGAIDIRASS